MLDHAIPPSADPPAAEGTHGLPGFGQLAGIGALLLCAAWPLQAQEPADSTRLSELWLERALPDQPAYSYYLREQHIAPQRRQGVRLQEELTTLIDHLTLAGHRHAARGLGNWREQIGNQIKAGSRTPARADLTALLAAPRQDPPLSALAEAGECSLTDWIELWSFGGVTRQPWTVGMSLNGLLREQPRDHWQAADTAWIISPQNAPRQVGTGAWNANDSALVPGTRVVLALPEQVQEADWVNRALPDFLSTRLPGDDCRRIPLPADTRNASEQDQPLPGHGLGQAGTAS
ncbi:hypothetical protein [Billgrantia endophytica]|uniref:Uncharacterized protein n=1 Tax=Billgrantia endophytica TaxID=2033802 RepID=A0A2N7U3K4_9GAMM|nr:hypothetical protein [Halomonas endophytica]PMR75024.1 hypothetical protein C1H69_11625 [Halomonas endophytica]